MRCFRQPLLTLNRNKNKRLSNNLMVLFSLSSEILPKSSGGFGGNGPEVIISRLGTLGTE